MVLAYITELVQVLSKLVHRFPGVVCSHGTFLLQYCHQNGEKYDADGISLNVNKGKSGRKILNLLQPIYQLQKAVIQKQIRAPQNKEVIGHFSLFWESRSMSANQVQLLVFIFVILHQTNKRFALIFQHTLLGHPYKVSVFRSTCLNNSGSQNEVPF